MKTHDYRKGFAPFGDKIWLNAASEGPLPKAAAASLREAIRWKSLPFELDHAKFASVPLRLKESIGRLINVPARDVILGNSASYGLHLLANGIVWQPGDEILLMQNDFPTNILPWLALEKKGVKVIQISPRDKVLTPEEMSARVTPRTRLFCVSQAHTFTGVFLDVEAFARICRERDIIFVVNISQSAGTRPVDASRLGADAVVCAGYKWLCGPYGTGFCWIKPSVRDHLELNQAYWIAMLSAEELKGEGALSIADVKSAHKYDIFGTANFFNFVPFRAAIDYFLEIGLENVFNYHMHLIEHFIHHLPSQYQLVSPRDLPRRSSLVVISHQDKERNPLIYNNLIEHGIYTALWKGNIRVAPHIFNTIDDLKKILNVLSSHL